jgi:hypothetical protein
MGTVLLLCFAGRPLTDLTDCKAEEESLGIGGAVVVDVGAGGDYCYWLLDCRREKVGCEVVLVFLARALTSLALLLVLACER